MARSRAELNAAADERARALGFTSRSQQYRAKKVGYGAKPAEYNAAVDRARSGKLTKRKTRGHLLGLKSTQAGTVISADLSAGQGPELWRELNRYKGDKRVRVTIETNDGSVIEVGGRGGMRLSYLRGMRHNMEQGRRSSRVSDEDRPRGGARIITVTVA